MQNMRTFSKFTGLTVLVATTAALAMVCLFMVGCACSASKPIETINGKPIYETDITSKINAMKNEVLAGGGNWDQRLQEAGTTNEELRAQIIREMEDMRLVSSYAGELGIEVSDEEVDKAWNELVGNMTESEIEALASKYGYTAASFKESLQFSLCDQKVTEYFMANTKCSEEELEDQVGYYLETYGGARKIERMRVEALDDAGNIDIQKATAEAERIKAAVENGEATFDDIYAANENQEQNQIGEDGWTFNMVLGDEYTEKLAGTTGGSVVTISGGGYVDVVRVVDVMPNANSGAHFADLPADIQEQVMASANGTAAYNARSAWLESLREKAEIVKG